MGFMGDRGGRRPGRSLLRGMLAALALTVPMIGAPIALDFEVDQWFRRGNHSVIPAASVVGLRGSSGFADGLLTVGDVDGDGRPEILVGGGRAGENVETGAAFLVGMGGDRRLAVERVFDGPLRKAGFGRYLFRGPGPDGAELIGMGTAGASDGSAGLISGNHADGTGRMEEGGWPGGGRAR
jgi:hypothetical protein